MARITVEDCLKYIKNRFELVLIASKRARQLMMGASPRVESDNDKATVIALREIAENLTDDSTLAESQTLTKTKDDSEISQEIIAETQTTVTEAPQTQSIIETEDAAQN